jgi:Tfp pilus assembly protein PilF
MWPSRRVAARDDLDLTPPEVREARRRKLLILLALLLVAVLAVAIYFAAPPVREAIKGWQSRRAARQALALIEQKKWDEAGAKARDALLLRRYEPEAWHAIARLLSRIGQNAAALEWWSKLDQQNRLTIEDRRDFAGAALAAGELTMAAKQIEALLAQQGGGAPVDILFAGQVAVRRSNAVVAVDYAERVMADKRANPYDILSAAILVLSVTTPESPQFVNAWKRIEDLGRDPGNAASLEALVFLAGRHSRAPVRVSGSDISFSLEPGVAARQQSSAASPLSGDTSLSLGPGPGGLASPTGATMGLRELADALEHHPQARPYHKLLAIQLRVQQDPALTGEYVADAVERFGKGDDETLATLAAWLNSLGQARKTLELLPLDRAVRSEALYLRHINALAALERWDEVQTVLTSERFPLEPVAQHMFLATAYTRLGQSIAATNEWQRALEAAAGDPGKLLTLAGYAEQNGANDTADATYAEAIKLTPKNRAAYGSRLRLARAAGHTADAEALAAALVRLWPDDVAAQNADAYLRLLLGASDGAAEAAERQAQILVAQEPWNWSARATLGLARLRLGKKEEALTAFRGIRATGSEPPGALAVRAAILAVNGHEEGARSDARLLGAEHLLPEERALIAPLLASDQTQ